MIEYCSVSEFVKINPERCGCARTVTNWIKKGIFDYETLKVCSGKGRYPYKHLIKLKTEIESAMIERLRCNKEAAKKSRRKSRNYRSIRCKVSNFAIRLLNDKGFRNDLNDYILQQSEAVQPMQLESISVVLKPEIYEFLSSQAKSTARSIQGIFMEYMAKYLRTETGSSYMVLLAIDKELQSLEFEAHSPEEELEYSERSAL